MAHYAWTEIRVKVNEWGKVEESKQPGDEVSQGDFEDMSDEDWEELVESGSVRETPYPAGALESGESPERHRTNLLAKISGGEQLTEEEMEELNNLTGEAAVSPPVMEGEAEGAAPELAPAPAAPAAEPSSS